MGSVRTFAGIAALVAGLATHAAAQQQCGPCGSDWVSYEMTDKLSLNTTLTVTSPFTSGSIFLTKTHRLLVPAGLNGAGPASPEPHYLGVELLPGTYDTTTTPPLTFTTALGSVTFKPGQLKFFYDPSSKSLTPPVPPAPPKTNPKLCFTARSGSTGPKSKLTTVDQFGTQQPALTGVDYACVDVTLDGSIPVENWMVCFNQKTKPALFPPDVWLTTQDLGSFPDIRMDPLDEVCVQARVQS